LLPFDCLLDRTVVIVAMFDLLSVRGGWLMLFQARDPDVQQIHRYKQ
jgi:hypothetical protein